MRRFFHERHQFRLVLCGHKAVEAGAVCLVLMVQGNLLALTPAHFELASKTGLLAVFPVLALSFTRYARHFANKWTCSALLGVFAFLADTIAHRSNYPGEYTEAALTGIGAFVFSVAISYTPVGKYIDHLAETFAGHGCAAANPEGVDEGPAVSPLAPETAFAEMTATLPPNGLQSDGNPDR